VVSAAVHAVNTCWTPAHLTGHFTAISRYQRRADEKGWDGGHTVKLRRLTLAGHILRVPADRPASVAMQWVPDGGERRRGCTSKTWRQTFQEDLRRRESAGVVFAESPVIGVLGKASSPNTQRIRGFF